MPNLRATLDLERQFCTNYLAGVAGSITSYVLRIEQRLQVRYPVVY